MKYFYKPPEYWRPTYGITYQCDHPYYNECTLYFAIGKGLAVVQRRFADKKWFWGPVDPWLANDIYLASGFKDYFLEHAEHENAYNLYPTVTVRQIMWALRMKPLQKEWWENDI